MAAEDVGKFIAALFGVVVGVLFLAACVVAAMAIFSVGAAFGGIVSTGNYLRSFTKNVRPETDPSGIIAKWVVGLICALLAVAGVALLIQFFNL